MDTDRLARTLLPRLRSWTADGWVLPASSGGGTRADAARASVQRIADLGADVEGRPRRAVPRLADIVLADQLAVVLDDIARTGDPAADKAATAELTALKTALGF